MRRADWPGRRLLPCLRTGNQRKLSRSPKPEAAEAAETEGAVSCWSPQGTPFVWLPKEGLRKVEQTADDAPSAMLVYLALCRIACDEGAGTFSKPIAYVSKLAGVGRRTVERRLPDLERASLVKIQRAALRTSHTYTLESFKQPHASQSRSVASQSRSVASRTPDPKSHLVENIENKRVVPAATKPPADELSETWLTGLQSDLAYQQLSVAVELARAKRWCETNNRRCTRRFFIGWLNRCRPAPPGAARGNGRPDQALLARVSDLRAQLAREYDRTKGEKMLAELKALEGQLTGGVQP